VIVDLLGTGVLLGIGGDLMGSVLGSGLNGTDHSLISESASRTSNSLYGSGLQ
jgi:hypothetical protein